MKALFYTFLFWIVIAPAFSQRSVMRHFDSKNGLPSNEVYQLLNDSKGYIWICTDAGLVKYNGNTFKQFNSSNGLPDNTIFQAKEDKYGRVWFISYAGKIGYISNDSVYVVNLGEKMEDFLTNGLITSIAFDENNNLYIGRRNLENVSFLKVSPPYRSVNISEIWKEGPEIMVSIHLLGEDFVFSDSRKALGRVNVPIKVYKDEELLIKENATVPKMTLFTRIYRKSDQIFLIIGTHLYNFNIATKNVQKKVFENNLITVVSVDSNKVMVGESRGGLKQLNERLELLDPEGELNGMTVTYLVKDHQGGSFVSTLESGVFYFPKQPISYLSLPIENEELIAKAIPNGSKKLLMISSRLNVYELDLSDQASPRLRPVYNNRVKAITEAGQIYMAGENKMVFIYSAGILELDILDGKTKLHSNNLIMARIRTGISCKGKALYHSITGITEVGTENGKVISRFYKSDDRLSCLAKDPLNNTIYAGGLRGLYKFNFADLTAKDKVLTCRTEDIKYDGKGTAFVATRQYGIIVLKNGMMDTIREKNGLLSDICKSITVDSNYIWVCTNSGISRVNYIGKNNYTIYNYPLFSFLQPSSINRIFLLNDKISFCSGNTVYWLDKNTRQSNSKLNIISVNANDVARKTIELLNFKSTESNIVINFEAILYDCGSDINYRYRLGEKSDWTYTKETMISLQKLSPGDYRIEIEVRNSRGNWLKFEPVVFSIDKPFYQKIWFIASCLLMIAAMVFVSVKKRYNRILKEQLIKSELRINMLELETKVVKAQMNPHFIFNSLNSIQQFILANENENAYKYLTKFSKLVRKLLESTTTEDLTLEDEIDLLNRYVEIEGLRFENAFNYEMHIDPELKISGLRIPHMIIQPFVENAIWHGLLHKKGERRLKISFLYLDEKCVTCAIDDNGVGRLGKNIRPDDKSSLAMDFIKKRLDIINELRGSGCGFKIIDKEETTHSETGTIVIVRIPIMNI